LEWLICGLEKFLSAGAQRLLAKGFPEKAHPVAIDGIEPLGRRNWTALQNKRKEIENIERRVGNV